MTTENITIIVSFIAVLVGIVGNTWDVKKKGIKKLTATGWLAIIIGLTTCTIGFYKNYQNEKEFNWQENQRQKIKNLAYKELGRIVYHFDYPIIILSYVAFERFKFDDSTDNKQSLGTFSLLRNKIFLNSLDSFNLKDTFKDNTVLQVMTWGEFFTENAKKNKEELNALWLKYQFYYDIETLTAINSLLNDEFLNMRLLEIDFLLNINNGRNLPVSVIFNRGPDRGSEYFKYLDKVDSLLTISNSKSDDMNF